LADDPLKAWIEVASRVVGIVDDTDGTAATDDVTAIDDTGIIAFGNLETRGRERQQKEQERCRSGKI